MLNQIGRINSGFLFSLAKILLFLAAFSFWAASPAFAEEAGSDPKTVPCKGLKPYNNLDELLYQFYINLDSDCLFEMSTAELEKRWGIKILDDEKFKPENFYPAGETGFYFKPYSSEKEAFYVEFSRYTEGAITFKLKITREYLKKYGTLFPDGKIPKSLPQNNGSYWAGDLPCKFPQFEKVTEPTSPLIEKFEGLEEFGFEPYTPSPFCSSPVWSRGQREIQLKDEGEIIISRRLNTDELKRRYEESEAAKLTGEDLAAAVEKAKNAPCRGLKPYNNLDELLYQFYINFDSDCLFTMPLEELEKIWGIKFFNADLAYKDPDYREKLKEQGYSFYNQPYESEKDAFYILVSNGYKKDKTTSFLIKATKDYLARNETLFLGGRLPGLLPATMMRSHYAFTTGPRYLLEYYVNSYNTRKLEYRGGSKMTGVAINGF